MRGEYRFACGWQVHNQFTDDGLQAVLAAAFQNIYPANLYIGLCQAVPSRGVGLGDLIEPTIGVNGYARAQVTRNNTFWPTTGIQAGDPYLESQLITFTASGGNFDQAITRMFLTPEQTSIVGDVWALSGALNTPLLIGPATPVGQRQFNYRIYGI